MIEIRIVLTLADSTLTGKGHEKTFWWDGNVVYLDWNVGFQMCMFFKVDWLMCILLCQLYLNNKCNTKDVGRVHWNYRAMQEPKFTGSRATNISGWEGLGVSRDFQNSGEWVPYNKPVNWLHLGAQTTFGEFAGMEPGTTWLSSILSISCQAFPLLEPFESQQGMVVL